MSKLSGIRDLDREILGKVDDKDLLKTCSIDKYTWNIVCDDNFLRRRLLSKYPEIEKYKLKGESWKRFFLRAISYISKMKKEYSYNYTFGDFFSHYYLIKYYNNNKIDIFLVAAASGELALVMKSLKEGVDIHYLQDYALRRASQHGHMEVVKYLVEQGANIKSSVDSALFWAKRNKHLEVEEYLLNRLK